MRNAYLCRECVGPDLFVFFLPFRFRSRPEIYINK